MPEGKDAQTEPALWHILHEDGDEEDLDELEMTAGLYQAAQSRSRASPVDEKKKSRGLAILEDGVAFASDVQRKSKEEVPNM